MQFTSRPARRGVGGARGGRGVRVGGARVTAAGAPAWLACRRSSLQALARSTPHPPMGVG